MTGMPNKQRCHRCGSDRLTISETVEEIHTFDGVVEVDGMLYGVGDGWSEAGSVLFERTRMRCKACDHSWHPRRPVGGPYIDDDTAP